jgi:hypothetical protein
MTIKIRQGACAWGWEDISREEDDARHEAYELAVRALVGEAYPGAELDLAIDRRTDAPIAVSCDDGRTGAHVWELAQRAWELACNACTPLRHLYDSDSANVVRAATWGEAERSDANAEIDGGQGHILVDGRRCYVEAP